MFSTPDSSKSGYIFVNSPYPGVLAAVKPSDSSSSDAHARGKQIQAAESLRALPEGAAFEFPSHIIHVIALTVSH